MTDTFLTIGEIAELFRTTPNAVYQRIHRTKRGRDSFPLPASGLGKRLLWLREEVERHIRNCAKSDTATPQSKTKPESRAVLAKHGIGTK